MIQESLPPVVLFDRRTREQKDYWTAKLAGLPEPAGLRPDFPRQSAPSGVSAWIEIRIEGALLASLRKLTSNGPFLLYTTLTAALQVCLFRYNGRSCTTGSPARKPEGGSPVANALAIAVSELNGRLPFRQLLGNVREALLAAYKHQEIPFTQVVRHLGLSEPADRNPLFDVALALEDIHGPMPDVGQNVTVTFSSYPAALAGTIEYKPALFRPDTVVRFVEHFIGALRSALEDVGRPIGELGFFGEGERHQTVVEWNDTAIRLATGQGTVHGAFEAQAVRTPDREAVVAGGLSLTFAELTRRANRLARHLRRLGVGPDMGVGLCLERSVDSFVGLFGILKAGGAYVPMDEAHPDPRLAAVLAAGRIGTVITRERMRERFAALGACAVCLDSDREAIEREDSKSFQTGATSESLAYVLFTSGSTGEPKGVMVCHRSVLNLAAALERSIYGTLDSGVLRVSVNGPLTFDTSVKQWIQLLAGRMLHLLSEEVRHDADLLLGYLDRHGVDVFDCTPSLLRLLLARGLASGRSRAPRAVLVGGEAIDPATWETLACSAGPRFWNVYGPTECTVDATVWPVVDGAPAIGRPIANVRLHILDRDGLPSPIGVPGELCIGGAGLARGYAAQPALTAAAFVPDPFSAPGERHYRTGDRARQRPDGTVEILGRIDLQVKVRGFRIEPGEIEAVLKTHPEVRDAVVAAREDLPGDLRLVAYAVPREGRPPKIEALRTFLSERLADSMVPAAIVLLDALPLNAHGKVDRRALPAPEGPQGGEERSERAAPRTPIEEAVAAIWSEVLGHGRMGIDDDFFALGGHSLLAMQVLSRILETFRIKVPLRVVFDRPTIAGMAEVVESDLRGGRTLELPPLLPVPRDRSLPLSFSQERLWFFDQLHPEEPAYNVGRAFRLRGGLDRQALARTLDEIVRRHESLRTTFAVSEGSPVQVVSPADRELALPWIDLSALPASVRETVLADLLASEPLRPFALDRGPLARPLLVQIGRDDHVLLLVFHHIVFDGWSLGILLREMKDLYTAFAAGRPSPLSELPVQYADFAVWQRGFLQGETLAAQLEHWKERLAGAPPELALPADRPRPALQTFRGARYDVAVPAVLARQLKDLCLRRGGTLFMVLLASFLLLLERWTGEEDLVVGMPTANRSRLGVESLIGFFVNTLVMRTDLAGAASFGELLDRVRDVALAAYAHQDLPFEKLIGELQPQRDLSRPALFQVLFVLQNAPLQDLELPGLTLEASEVDPERVLFDLVLSAREVEDGLAFSFRYNADLFDRATAARLAEGYGRLLAAAAATPEAPLAELPLLSEEERHQLAVEWNDTSRFLPDRRGVHELFCALAARDPEGIALRFEGKDWTRRQLLEEAQARASWHREGAVAVVRAERSPETILEILGVMLAGGAYVPVDPEDPEERRRFVLEDLETVAELRDTAYILYTSGSTGRPKGVVVSHSGLRNLVEAQIPLFDIRPGDRVLQFASPAFDASVSEIFTALVAGACLVLAPKNRLLPGPDLAGLLRDERISVVTLPPSALAALPFEPFPDLRTLVVAGEACPHDLIERWKQGRRLVNGYGPTETTVCATGDPDPAGASIGRPIPGMRVHLLDRHLRLAPRGSAAEICAGGLGVAQGYLNRPALTAARFVPDPFAEEPGARLFRTGDLARQRSDGRIEFLGRIDHQLKLRGFRIEPGEVEEALRSHPKVRDAAVAAQPIEGSPVLVAYVVPAGESVPEPDLREHLRQRLPSHMVPGRFVFLAALPLTSRGKLDRRALPAPDDHRPGLGAAFAAPRTPLEESLAACWAGVLGLEKVGIHDDFFELGGHSLLATYLVEQLQWDLKVEIPVRVLFENPTVAGLAEVVESLLSSNPSDLARPPL